ncbi:MAG: DUF1232 domain-containing protein [Terrimesophilobacter sp.]
MALWLQILLGLLGGVIVLWLALVAFLLLQQRRSGQATDWREIARLAPDVVRLIKRLGTDRAVPRGTRIWLLILLAYLLTPIDLIPDFVPVLGFVDDAIIVAVALRYATKHAGAAAIERNWPGTTDGLRTVLALTGLT